MSNKSGFFLNSNDFIRDFNVISKKIIPDKAEKASFKVGWMVLKDAKKVPPKAPREIGDLHSSGEVHPLGFGQLGAVMGFNKDYAAKWHELPKAKARRTNWSLPGSGRKYLETKLFMFKEKYLNFVASLIHA